MILESCGSCEKPALSARAPRSAFRNKSSAAREIGADVGMRVDEIGCPCRSRVPCSAEWPIDVFIAYTEPVGGNDESSLGRRISFAFAVIRQ
jgi:hypothetical protein